MVLAVPRELPQRLDGVSEVVGLPGGPLVRGRRDAADHVQHALNALQVREPCGDLAYRLILGCDE